MDKSDEFRFQDILSKQDKHFSYSISAFVRGLSSMLIRVKELESDNGPCFYVFYTPDYFEGRMTWRGGGFYIAANEELETLARELYPLSNEEWRKSFIKEYALLKSDIGRDRDVKIIATSASKYDHVPPDFRSIVGDLTW